MGAAGSSARRRLRWSSSARKTAEEDGQLASGSDDDRDQLAECLAFISDMALTGDSEPGGHRSYLTAGPATAATGTCAQCLPAAGAADDDDDEGKDGVAAAAEERGVEEELVPEPTDRGGSSGGGRARWLRHRLKRLRLQRQRSAPVSAAAAAAADHSLSSHIQMLNSMDSQDDDSEDWAEMRSWLVWCLREKLGDTGDFTCAVRRSPSPRRTVSVSRSSRGSRQLVRQQAVHERSPRIGVIDCSPVGSTAAAGSVDHHPGGRGPMLRCRSAETGRRYGASLDSGSGAEVGGGGDTARLTVGASCSGQSSFESYGSTG